MCFLQGPEGELQSSPSWPLHHFSDTDRLQHPHSLSPPRQHLSTPRLAFPQLSILPNLIFLHSSPLLSLLFSCPLLSVCCRALCVLPCISQVLIKSLTSGAWIMFRLCFFFPSSLYSAHFLFFHLFLLALPFFLLSPAIMQEGRLNPQCSLSPLRPEIWHFLPAVTPSSYSSYFPFTFPSIPPPSTFSLNLSLILELINPAQGHDESARTLSQY